MIAVAVVQKGRVEVVEIPKPSPGPYDALVRNGERHGWREVYQIMKKVPDDIPLEAAALLCTLREVSSFLGRECRE